MKLFKLFLKLFGAWILCWILGSLAGAIYFLWAAEGDVPNRTVQTAVFSFFIITPAFLVFHLPILIGFHRILLTRIAKPLLVTISAVLYLIPLGLVYYSSHSEHWLSAMFSSADFHVVLFVTGLAFGLCFVAVMRKFDLN